MLSSPAAIRRLQRFAQASRRCATPNAQPFFGGDEPLYADNAVFNPLQWARCISPLEMLEKDDPVRLWRDRLLDCFGGLARAAPAYDV
jgi:hypothetical protein